MTDFFTVMLSFLPFCALFLGSKFYVQERDTEREENKGLSPRGKRNVKNLWT